MHTPAPDLPPYRPPSEAGSVLVRVTRGCPWNRCTFCDMYKRTKFEVRPLEEIEADLAILRATIPAARSIFLADSDSLAHPRIHEVVQAVRRTFPKAERMTSYARLTTLQKRAPEKLRALREAGLTRIHAGLESGAAPILARVEKGLTPEKAIVGSQKATRAGFALSLYVLCGLGGEDDWERHAAESARVVRACAPQFVRLRSLILVPHAPLRAAWARGEFRPITPLTRLHEIRCFVEELGREPLGDMQICSDHFSNLVWIAGKRIFEGIEGTLPRDHATLLALLHEVIRRTALAERPLDPGTLAIEGKLFGAVGPTSL